jgi:hypothetical protein
MPKHRGPNLEHQTSILATLSDFSMENAINNSDLGFCLTVRPRQPSLAMVELRLMLGNKRFLGHDAACGDEISSKSVSFSLI